jgi:hypothetical protein
MAAAEQAKVTAMHTYVIWLETGKVTFKNFNTAFKDHKGTAKKGSMFAQSVLAILVT